jgi:hypothetical protein
LRAGNDFQIQFHGHAVRLYAKLPDQYSDGQGVRKLALFAIDVEEHKKQLANSNQLFLKSRSAARDLYSSIKRGERAINFSRLRSQIIQVSLALKSSVQ